MTASKISLTSLSDLKNTLDDHLPLFLTSPNLLPSSGPCLPKPLRFTQSHLHTYIRLSIGYSAVAIAAYLFYLDWYLKVPFSAHKSFAAPASIVYLILNGALTAWIWFGEKGIVFGGTRKEKGSGREAKLQLYSRAPHRKYDPVYRLEAVFTDGAGGSPKSVELTAPFTTFFAADGYFVPAKFEIWLRENIPGLGDPSAGSHKAEDTKKAVAVGTAPQLESLNTSGLIQDEEDDDVVMVGSDVLQGSIHASAREIASTPSGKKRPKRKA